MATSDRTLERPIDLCRRQDLIVVPQRFGSTSYWVIKDPLSLRFVRLREGEYVLFNALDGRNSLHDLANLFEAKFAPQRIKPQEISRFVGMLHQSGLLVSSRHGQGPILEKRGRERRQREFRGQWLNPLAIRFRGIDPTRLFDVLYPWVRPLFTRTAFIASLIFMSSALLLVGVRWTTLAAKLPTFQEFFTPSNIVVLTIVMGLIKVLHEFGHGLTCRHFGGESRELGAMFLVFTPCLYCDVTDSWRFPNKWHRAAVGAAGIFVELNLAAAATFIWWFSAPGLLNQICLGIMTVSSLGTAVFNGNPLMRYDGYYILADLVETPNLAERSSAVVRHYFSQICLGIEGAEDPLLPAERRGWYAAYAIASGVYRWIVTFSIIVFLVAAARPYRLENLARLLGMSGLAALVLAPLMRLKKFVDVPGAWQRMKRKNVAISSGVALFILGLFFLLPLPHRVFGPLEMQPYHPASIYVEVPGRLVETAVRYGQTVAPDTLVARLENRDIDLAVEELTSRRDEQRAELASLRRQQFDTPSAGRSIPQTEKLLTSLEEQLDRKLQDQTRLTLTSSQGGTLFPPSHMQAPPDDDNLHEWTGRPLDAINRGCTFEIGLLLGQVGDAKKWQALIVLDQEDVEFVKPGQDVEVLLDALPERIFRGRVEEIAIGEMRETPRRLSNKSGGELSTKSGSQSVERPASTSYQVRVQLDDPDGAMRVGWRGQAKIHVPDSSLGMRILRRLSRTFHFHL